MIKDIINRIRISNKKSDKESLTKKQIIWIISSNSNLTINELAVKISSEKNMKKEQVLKILTDVIEENKIKIRDSPPPRNILQFLLPSHCIWFWTIIGFIIIQLLSASLLPSQYPFTFIKAGIGLLWILYIPGKALIESIYSKGDEIDGFERIILSIGLSITLVPLVGLLLNITPWGLLPETSSLAIFTLTLIFSIIAVYKKFRISQNIYSYPVKKDDVEK